MYEYLRSIATAGIAMLGGKKEVAAPPVAAKPPPEHKMLTNRSGQNVNPKFTPNVRGGRYCEV